MDLSVVIAYHQEGRDFILEAVNQIKDTIDINDYEIIIVDDGSRRPLKKIKGVKIFRQPQNLGVGQALRRGIWEAQSDNVWFQGSDIRLIKNNWASKMIKEIQNHPKALTCATCVGLNNESPEGMDMETRRNRSRRNGANILFFRDKKSHPKVKPDFRDILAAQWLPLYRGEGKESFEIPCILGAAYGASKQWLRYIDIWWGHRSWGTLEPYCSIASWLMGGSCRTAPDIEAGHIFKKEGTHGTPPSHLTFNKILVATLMFEDGLRDRLINFLGTNPQMVQSRKMFEEVKGGVVAKREEYKKKIVYDVREYCKRFNIDLRE